MGRCPSRDSAFRAAFEAAREADRESRAPPPLRRQLGHRSQGPARRDLLRHSRRRGNAQSPGRKERNARGRRLLRRARASRCGPRTATILAKTSVLTMAIARRSFLKLVKGDSELALGLLKVMAERLRGADQARVA